MLELLRCPDCATELVQRDGTLRCRGCGRGYPAIAGIPVLHARAEEIVDNWRYRAGDFVADNAATRTKILAELAGDAQLDTTRVRLETLHEKLADHEARLVEILTEAGLAPLDRQRPEGEIVPGEGSITAYYHQIHRDWGWAGESDEAEQMLREVSLVLEPGARLGATLVLGAGAARLPMDLHRTFGGGPTLALDLNPLPFIVASKILHGETVSLFEWPVRPQSSTAVTIDRLHQGPHPSPEDFHLLFADGLRPPVADEAFDTVLTPWFIDQVPHDLAELVPEIRRVLRPGGRWLNFGPLVYHPAHTHIVHRYCADEVLELLARGGFDVVQERRSRMKYMESPACSQGRTELVLTFDARKTERVASVASPVAPAWLDDPTLPVELEGLAGYEPPHPMFAAVASMVDGKRSIRDIADVLVRAHGVPEEAAVPGVQACLREIIRKVRGDKSVG